MALQKTIRAMTRTLEGASTYAITFATLAGGSSVCPPPPPDSGAKSPGSAPYQYPESFPGRTARSCGALIASLGFLYCRMLAENFPGHPVRVGLKDGNPSRWPDLHLEDASPDLTGTGTGSPLGPWQSTAPAHFAGRCLIDSESRCEGREE